MSPNSNRIFKTNQGTEMRFSMATTTPWFKPRTGDRWKLQTSIGMVWDMVRVKICSQIHMMIVFHYDMGYRL